MPFVLTFSTSLKVNTFHRIYGQIGSHSNHWKNTLIFSLSCGVLEEYYCQNIQKNLRITSQIYVNKFKILWLLNVIYNILKLLIYKNKVIILWVTL